MLVVTVNDEGKALGAFHTGSGRVSNIGSVDDLEQLCTAHGARRCIVLDEHALSEIGERAALRVQPEDDYLGQWITIMRAARELRTAGRIKLFPDSLGAWPLPNPQLLTMAANLLLPNDHCAVLTIFENHKVWTAAALRRRHDVIDVLAGPDEIAQWVGPLGGDFRRDQRVICSAVERHFAPVHLGIFTEASTLERLFESHAPGRWARAVAARDIVVYPTPGWLSLVLGAEGLWGLAASSTHLLAGLDPDETRDYLQGVIRGFTDGQELPDLLSWEPVRLLVEAIAPKK